MVTYGDSCCGAHVTSTGGSSLLAPVIAYQNAFIPSEGAPADTSNCFVVRASKFLLIIQIVQVNEVPHWCKSFFCIKTDAEMVVFHGMSLHLCHILSNLNIPRRARRPLPAWTRCAMPKDRSPRRSCDGSCRWGNGRTDTGHPTIASGVLTWLHDVAWLVS